MAKPEIRRREDGMGAEVIPDQDLVIGRFRCPGDGTPNSAHTLSMGAQKGAVPSQIDCFAHPGVAAILSETVANGTGGMIVS